MQVLKQIGKVGRELRDRVRGRKPPTPPVATQVGNNDAISGRKVLNERFEHLAGDHQAMNQQEWRPCSPLGKMEEIHETKRSACGFLLSNPGAACLVEAVGDIGLEDARSAPCLSWNGANRFQKRLWTW